MIEKVIDTPICGNKCSGCGACTVICARQCIKMEINKRGFYRPVKNGTRCINCGLCKKVCPQLSIEALSLDNADLYAAHVQNEQERRESSSGGIAYCLANYGIHNGYGICGVIMNYKMFRAEHRVFMPGEEVNALKGSKYLQSNPSAFTDIIVKLQADKDLKFIVFGTPCQVAGYNQILRRKKLRDRVILVDIFCHGVPSNLLWSKYLGWLERKKKVRKNDIMSVTFRDKNYSWHQYYMHIKTSSQNGEGIDYVANTDKDPFLKIFTMGAVNQKSCFTCLYRNQSAADIRLGDYWGTYYKNTEEGVSMVLVNTPEGMDLMNAIREKIVLSKRSITERFGQQHTNYQYPKYYDVSFEILLDEKAELKSIINLYENGHDRIKKKVKKIVKAILRRS